MQVIHHEQKETPDKRDVLARGVSRRNTGRHCRGRANRSAPPLCPPRVARRGESPADSHAPPVVSTIGTDRRRYRRRRQQRCCCRKTVRASLPSSTSESSASLETTARSQSPFRRATNRVGSGWFEAGARDPVP